MTHGDGSAVERRAAETRASGTRRWVGAHAIAAYVILAYALSWAYWVPLALGEQSVEHGVGWPTQMPGLLGPAIAAGLVTAVTHGRAGLAGLWSRLRRWRVGWWWLAVVAVVAAGAVGVALGGGADNAGDLVRYNGIDDALGPLATIATVFVLNGIGEETGWRGFLADDLLQRHTLTATSLLVASVWAPWHLPLFFLQRTFEDFTAAGTVGWVVGLTAGSIVLTWLYRGSGASILLVAVWHTAFNFTSATTAAEGPPAAISSTLVMAAAITIVVADRWNARRSSSVRTQGVVP
jgi:CAAX protease family protein